MAIGWYLCPYKRDLTSDRPRRYCAMDDFTTQIFSEGGRWTESECLGDHAVVKVRASAATLAIINATPGFVRLPVDVLDNSLSSLTNAQKTAITNKLQDLGYPLSEIRADLGNNIGNKTLRSVLMFALKRRLKPRYDQATDTIICDGIVQACRPLVEVDTEVI